MNDTAYITRNHDGSLRSRIDEYLDTLSQYQNVQSSMKHSSDPEWVDVLGEKEDIQQADKILKNSMTRITDMISQNEIKEALTQGFMTEAQAWELSKAKEQTDKLSKKDSKSHSRLR